MDKLAELEKELKALQEKKSSAVKNREYSYMGHLREIERDIIKKIEILKSKK